MEIEQALRVHSQLAHALLPWWRVVPQLQPILSARLGQWKTLQTTDDAFFGLVVQDFQTNGLQNGQLIDAVNTARSEPIDKHLRLMFDEALACAQKLYARYGRWTGGNAVSLDDFGCQTPHYPDQSAFGAFGASASTTPGLPGRDAIVELLLVPQLLGSPTWASVPYVICHEVLCHASQAASSSDSTDPFTEGWMDAVASTVHAKSASALFPWDPDAAVEEGQRLSSVLRTLGSGLSDLDLKARSARLQGFHAACTVRGVLGSLANLSKGRHGQRLFERLSVELNTVPSAGQERDLAVHRAFVSNVLASRRDLARATHRDALLRKWVLAQLSAAEVLSFM
jgi:hypothetical protein